MEQEALFVGHTSFKNKSGNQLYLIQFLTTQKTDRGVEASVVSVFTNKDIYETYINTNDLLSEALLMVRISQGRVFYDIVQ